MENSSSSHDYGCSTSQEIPHPLENLQGDDNYKTLHINPIHIATKLSVYFVGDYFVQKNLHAHIP